MHARRQIREAIGALLVGLPTTGANVFQGRVYALQDSELPGLRIETVSESATPITFGSPPVLERVLQIRVVGIAKATADLDDTLDAICEQVEKALCAGIEPLARAVFLTGTEIELTGTAEQPTGEAALTFEVRYSTTDDAPDVAL